MYVEINENRKIILDLSIKIDRSFFPLHDKYVIPFNPWISFRWTNITSNIDRKSSNIWNLRLIRKFYASIHEYDRSDSRLVNGRVKLILLITCRSSSRWLLLLLHDSSKDLRKYIESWMKRCCVLLIFVSCRNDFCLYSVKKIQKWPSVNFLSKKVKFTYWLLLSRYPIFGQIHSIHSSNNNNIIEFDEIFRILLFYFNW